MRLCVGRVVAAVVLLACPPLGWAARPEYEIQTKTATASSSQSDTTLWTPASGKSIALLGCHISTNRPLKVEIESSNTDVVPPIYTASEGGVLVGGNDWPIWVGDANATLTYTTSTDRVANTHGEVSILCWGFEFNK